MSGIRDRDVMFNRVKVLGRHQLNVCFSLIANFSLLYVRFVPEADVRRSAFLITYLTMICTVKL